MPSFRHEAIVFLFREAPELAIALLERVTGWRPPPGVRASLTEINAGQLQPTERRADAAIALCDAAGKPCCSVIVEAQLERDDEKRFAWPEYVAAAQARLRVPCFLLVFAPDPAVAAWARTPVEFGRPGYGFAPVVVGPEALPTHLDPADLERLPELGVLTAQTHGQDAGIVDLVTGLLRALVALSKRRRLIYLDMLLVALGPDARKLVEAEMPQEYQFQSEFARRYYDQGLADGAEEGRRAGAEEGREENKRDVARRLLARGLSPAEVAQLVELDPTEVAKLAH